MDTSQDVKDLVEKIRTVKTNLKEALVILTHHYQSKEIVELGDFLGDSFGLSQDAAALENAKYIVFCGVHFMAESAAILAKPGQVVQIPEMAAGCPMADMADAVIVQQAWDELAQFIDEQNITPLVYMNSDAELKAFCGRHGGAVCTSSNAVTALRWGFSRSQKILFFPDQHLGRNSANILGLAEKERIVWQPGKPLGGNRRQDIERAKIILWDGYCHVHTKFTPEHIRHARQTYPEAKIIVHPECPEEVVNLADASGSTSQIVSYVKNSSQADTILIGTEINLIERLALENTDKSIQPLTRSVCPNMAKINLRNLLETLENLGRKNIVTIEKHIKQDAQKALDRMLALKP